MVNQQDPRQISINLQEITICRQPFGGVHNLFPQFSLKPYSTTSSSPLPPRITMPRRSSNATKHFALHGHEVCIHTCGCAMQRDSPLWRCEGGACPCHSALHKAHPTCSPDFPCSAAFMTGAPHIERTLNPTREEILQYLSPGEAALELQCLGL